MDSTFLNRLKKFSKKVYENEPMKNHTTFKIGGPADFFVMPEDTKELVDIISLCKEENMSYMIMGNGSNLLVSDKGIEGVVIEISSFFTDVKIENTTIIAKSGILMSRLSKYALNASLSGFECLSGIPGTLGGAVYMNAGAYGSEMKDIVKSVTYLDEDLNIKKALREELGFGYRKSIFTDRKCVILEVEMEFVPGNIEEISEKIKECTEKRTSKQPLNLPSAGSVFKRPQGYFAGALIEEAGLKGYSVGGAQVSEKHAGFIVNKENASAQDVLDLIRYIQEKVKDLSGVLLETEIKLIGR